MTFASSFSTLYYCRYTCTDIEALSRCRAEDRCFDDNDLAARRGQKAAWFRRLRAVFAEANCPFLHVYFKCLFFFFCE